MSRLTIKNLHNTIIIKELPIDVDMQGQNTNLHFFARPHTTKDKIRLLKELWRVL